MGKGTVISCTLCVFLRDTSEGHSGWEDKALYLYRDSFYQKSGNYTIQINTLSSISCWSEAIEDYLAALNTTCHVNISMQSTQFTICRWRLTGRTEYRINNNSSGSSSSKSDRSYDWHTKEKTIPFLYYLHYYKTDSIVPSPSIPQQLRSLLSTDWHH